jgi:hypothetical protein
MAKIHDIDEGSRAPWAIPVILTLVALVAGVWLSRHPNDIDPLPPPPPSGAANEARAPAPRCVEVSKTPFVVGEEAPRPAGAEPSASGDPPEENEDPTAPFAVEVSRGAAFDHGFAVGVRRDAEGAAMVMLATVNADGSNGALVKLGRSRGDLDPPVIAGAGPSILAVVIEPNASGRALKVARVTGTEVNWGPEFPEGRDDSLVAGVASSGSGAVVVWDELSGVGESQHSAVMLASFDVATMRDVKRARAVSPKESDASAPHVTSRPGGYWLAYLVRGAEEAKKRGRKPKDKDKDEDDENEDQGEAIFTSWVEVVPLDENGSPLSAPRAISPKSGRVVSFDLAPADNGNALVAWREDDAPTGASGGKVSAALVRLGGGGEPHVLSEKEGGTGAPDLLPGWISIASVNGPTRIAALSASGELLDELGPETSLGAGEPVAASREAILWARPAGKAMRLSVLRCQRPVETASEASEGGAAKGGPAERP